MSINNLLPAIMDCKKMLTFSGVSADQISLDFHFTSMGVYLGVCVKFMGLVIVVTSDIESDGDVYNVFLSVSEQIRSRILSAEIESDLIFQQLGCDNSEPWKDFQAQIAPIFGKSK